MKKISKKLSYLVKVLMAFGLLFVNVSSISVVFAAEDLEPMAGETENVEPNDNQADEDDTKQGESEELQKEDGENNQGTIESDPVVSENQENTENQNVDDEQVTTGENENQVGTETDEGTVTGSETTGSEITDDDEIVPSEEPQEETLYGDINKDGVVNEDDLNLLMEQIVGSKEVEDTKVSDLNEDEKVDTLDSVILYDYLKYLKVIPETRRIMPDEYYEEEYEPFVFVDEETKIPSKMDGDVDNLQNGATFDLQYIVTLSDLWLNGIDGLIDYDKTKLELSDVSMNYFDSYGASEDGRFLYIGDYIITIPEIDEDGNTTGEILDTDYVIVTMTFKALQTGTSTVSVKDVLYIWDETVFTGCDGSSIDVTVNVSSDNTLKSLTVAGQEIALSEDQFDYTITVSNDTTEADIEAVLNNDNAKITSVSPVELEVGENTITIKVTAENGDVRIYTITVIREAAETEDDNNSEATVTPTAITYPVEDTTDDDAIVVPDDDNDDKKDDNKKKDDKEEKTDKVKGNLSRIIIIILILLVVAGLIFLIFKDDDDDDEDENKHNARGPNKRASDNKKTTTSNKNRKK